MRRPPSDVRELRIGIFLVKKRVWSKAVVGGSNGFPIFPEKITFVADGRIEPHSQLQNNKIGIVKRQFQSISKLPIVYGEIGRKKV